ncbi:MAG: DHA2 family efflux MFS transporter permease subunit [Micromonosporaceae bacterium]
MSKFRGNPWAVLIVVSSGFFMTLLDLTIVNIAIPNMIDKLHAGLDEILWVINGYALVLAVLLITSGRLGDLRGPRNVFVAGITIFTLASAACGLSANAGQLIAFRVLQGLGAALLMPQTMTILTTVFPPERRGAAFGVWGAVAGVATIAGPTLGGLLVTAFDWRWIFFVNLPIGVCVLAATFILIPDMRPGRRHRLDLAGVLLAGASLFAICFGLVEGQRYNWAKITSFLSIPLILAAGVVLLAAFLLVEKLRQGREPLVPFAVFRDRNFSLMNFVTGTLAIGMLGIFLPFTIYLQSVLGMSALKAGLTLAPASFISMLLAPVAGRLADRIGGKYILFTGLSLFAIGMGWAAATAQPGSRWYDFLPGLIVAGTGMGCIFAPLGTVAMRDVQPQLAGAASGLFNTNRQVGAVIGSAAVGALLQNRLVASLTSQAAERGKALPPAARAGFARGFKEAAKSGLQVGAGQTGGSVNVRGVPPQTAQRLLHDIFTHGFVAAMHPTMAMPIAVIGVAALSCLGVKRHKGAAPEPSPESAEVTTTA